MAEKFACAQNMAHTGTAANLGADTRVVLRWPLLIGSGDLTAIRLCDVGWYRPSTGEVSMPNAFTIVSASLEYNSTFKPFLKAASRTWVNNPGDNATDNVPGTDLVLASQFGVSAFTKNSTAWARIELSFAATNLLMPVSTRITTHVSGSMVRSFNPANTTVVNGVDGTGAFTFSGTTPTTRTLGYCPFFVGIYSDANAVVALTNGDSIAERVNDTSFVAAGIGMIQRALYGDGTNIISGANFAKSGAFETDFKNSPKMYHWLKYCNVYVDEALTNDFGVNPGTSITAETALQRVVDNMTLAKAQGCYTVRTLLGPSTQSASTNWTSDADQTPIAAWGAGGRVPQLNAMLYSLVGTLIDYIVPMAFWRSPTNQYVFLSNGTNDYATADGIHPQTVAHVGLALEIRAGILSYRAPATLQAVTLNLSYRDPETDLLESNPISDTTPNPFTFTDQTGVALDSDIESNTVTITGISAPSPISITGGSYKINSGSYTTAPGNVNNNDTVRVMVHSSASNSTAASATVTIGGVSVTFTATTLSGSATLLSRLDLSSGVPNSPGAGGWGFGALGGATIAVANDGGANYLRAVYPIDDSEFQSGANYIYGGYSPVTLQQELYVTIYARMPGPYRNGCKFCKFFGLRDGENYANATFGTSYSSDDRGCLDYIGFADGTSTANDINNAVTLYNSGSDTTGRNGSLTKTIQSSTTFASSEWGSTWHKFQFRLKMNSGTNSGNEVNDGAIEVYIDGVMRARAINIFNRHPSNGFIETINFFGYSKEASAPFEVHMREITVALGGWID